MLPDLHEEIRRHGWGLAFLAGPQIVAEALSPYLADDPRGPGKQHARDVIRWSVPRGGIEPHMTGSVDGLLAVEACESIAHTDMAGRVTDDFSRMPLTELAAGLAESVLSMIPPEARTPEGRMSADYFRYSHGTGSPPHQDGFGEWVAIWCLRLSGGGAESFLTRAGRDVMRRALQPGEVLIFRDDLFEHGLTTVDGERDALICITLKER